MQDRGCSHKPYFQFRLHWLSTLMLATCNPFLVILTLALFVASYDLP